MSFLFLYMVSSLFRMNSWVTQLSQFQDSFIHMDRYDIITSKRELPLEWTVHSKNVDDENQHAIFGPIFGAIFGHIFKRNIWCIIIIYCNNLN